MSDVSPRRRMLGRLLLAGGALALPLTASISYAAAQEQPLPPADVAPSEVPPPPPSPPVPPPAPGAPEAPLPPQAPHMEGHEQRIVLRHPGDDPAIADEDLGPGEHHVFKMRIDGPLTAEQQKHFEDMRKMWEKKGAEWRKMGKDHEKMAFAMADMRAHMPEVSNDCDKAGGDVSRSWTDKDGRQHVVICERRVREQAQMGQRMALMGMDHARMGLHQARDTIAANNDLSPSVKQEVLADLDKEIARLDAQQ